MYCHPRLRGLREDADNAAAVGEEHEIIAALETIVRMDKKN